jgi:lipopolysaccharide transport system ATP-binding protein
MTAPAIKVMNVSKRYRLGTRDAGYRTLREAVMQSCGRLNPFSLSRNCRPQRETAEIWALRDISFEAQPGAVIGVIGRNGAGKSTLLKILSRITEPTLGRAEIRGRVGSLLEIGTGFHPELTGRENIFLNGAILGMKKSEIARKFDEIVAFAELERFIDTPVKRYSSGMYMRLAFAVAAHLESEILFVDEVLAVGDSLFQNKCLGKMGDVAKGGRTVLFVSHNLEAIAAITRHSLVLSGGRNSYHGPTLDALAHYQQEIRREGLQHTDTAPADLPKIVRMELRTTHANNVQVHSRPMEIHFEIFTPFPIRGASLSFQICSALRQPVTYLWTFDSERPMCREAGVYRIVCRIPQLHLYMGHYSFAVYFSERPGGIRFQALEGICPFEVVMYGHTNDFGWHADSCTYIEDCRWEIEKSEDTGIAYSCRTGAKCEAMHQ